MRRFQTGSTCRAEVTRSDFPMRPEPAHFKFSWNSLWQLHYVRSGETPAKSEKRKVVTLHIQRPQTGVEWAYRSRLRGRSGGPSFGSLWQVSLKRSANSDHPLPPILLPSSLMRGPSSTGPMCQHQRGTVCGHILAYDDAAQAARQQRQKSASSDRHACGKAV
jgi:hypothetical protein